MRNKIKQLLKKEDGFTLVELLGVIVILGLIIAIAIPSISGVIKNTEKDAKIVAVELAYDHAELYAIQSSDNSITKDTVNFGQLKSANVLTDEELKAMGIDVAVPTDLAKAVKTHLDFLKE